MSSLPPPRPLLSDLTDAIADTKAPIVMLRELKYDYDKEKKAREILEKRISLIEDQLRTLIEHDSETEWAPEDDEEETEDIDWVESS